MKRKLKSSKLLIVMALLILVGCHNQKAHNQINDIEPFQKTFIETPTSSNVSPRDNSNRPQQISTIESYFQGQVIDSPEFLSDKEFPEIEETISHPWITEVDYAGIGTPFPQSDQIIAPENLGDLKQVARWGRGKVQCVAYSPNGKWIAVGTTIGIGIYDATLLDGLNYWYDLNRWVDSLAFDNSGEHLAVVSGGQVEIIETLNGESISSYSQVYADKIHGFIDDRIVLISFKGTKVETTTLQELILWDYLSDVVIAHHSKDIVAVSENNRFAVVKELNKTYSIINTLDGGRVADLADEELWYVEAIAVGNDGENIVLGKAILREDIGNPFDDPKPVQQVFIDYYDLNEQQKVFQYPAELAYLRLIPDTYGCDTDFIAHCIMPYVPRVQLPIEMKYDRGGDTFGILYGEYDPVTLALYDRVGNLIALYGNQNNPVKDFSFAVDIGRVVVAYQDGSIKLIDVRTGNLIKSFQHFSIYIEEIFFSPDGLWLVIKRESGYEIRRLSDGGLLHQYDVSELMFSRDGKFIYTGDENGLITLRDFSSGNYIEAVEAHRAQIQSLALSPDGTLLVSTGKDCAIRLWRASNLTEMRYLDAYWPKDYPDEETRERIKLVSFSNEGDYLIGLSQHEALLIWDVRSGTLLQAFDNEIFDKYFDFFSVYPENNTLILLNNLVVIDLLSGEEFHQNVENLGYCGEVIFRAREGLLMLNKFGNYLCWMQGSEYELHIQKINESDTATQWTMISSLALSPDGRLLALAHGGGVISILSLP
jgi:WD40 repeat protein